MATQDPTGRVIVKVTVTNTDPRLIQWLQGRFGGSVSVHHRVGVKTRYNWQARNRDLVTLLTGCGPFLLIKREQADVALALIAMVRPRGQGERSANGRRLPLPQDEVEQREALRAQMRVLNGTVSGKRRGSAA